MSDLTEIRWHGRGGQGVVTASELLAQTALEEGKYFQAFPEFGAERSGAPIRAYTRISSHSLHLHCGVNEPDAVVVLDGTLLRTVDVADGLKEKGALVVNTALSPQELRAKLGLKKGRVFAVDATKIAMDTMGRNITNTPMMGALIKATGVVKKDSVVNSIRARLGARLSQRVVEANVQALDRAYDEVKEG